MLHQHEGQVHQMRVQSILTPNQLKSEQLL